jgi:hypothetical protein
MTFAAIPRPSKAEIIARIKAAEQRQRALDELDGATLVSKWTGRSFDFVPMVKRPFTSNLADFQKQVAALPTYSDEKLFMTIEKAQEIVDFMRAQDPPLDPKWCDYAQALIDAKLAEKDENQNCL